MSETTKRPGDVFISMFTDIEEALRHITNCPPKTGFGHMVNLACDRLPTIRQNKSFLQSIGLLRNSIVHDKGYTEDVIADPRQDVIDKFSRIIKVIKSPTKVYPKFKKKVQTFDSCKMLGEVLSHMHEYNYSQVVIKLENEHFILTTEGIAKWLSSAVEIGLADIEGASLADVFKYEDKAIQRHISVDGTVDEAISTFETALAKNIPRLPAILITNTGRASEEPVGIITPWDLIGSDKN